MREGLLKGTETMKKKALENFVDFECPHCHKIIKLKPFEAKQRTYCSQECSQQARHEEMSKQIQDVIELNKHNYLKLVDNRVSLIIEWLKQNSEKIINCKLNNLKFLSELAEYIGVKDTRTVGKALGVSGKKDIILKLKELIKIYANPSDVKSEYSKEETPGNVG